MKKFIIFIIILFLVIVGISYFSKQLNKIEESKYVEDIVEDTVSTSESARLLSIQNLINAYEMQIILNSDNSLVITDLNYASYSGEIPTSIELNINNYQIINGTFIYEDITYYYDGKNISRR